MIMILSRDNTMQNEVFGVKSHFCCIECHFCFFTIMIIMLKLI